ncbi:MAG: PKD domain-containing protein, partial [Bacteroidales bacterium]
MKKIVIILMLVFLSGHLFSQNLVYNPSFEDVNSGNLQCSWYVGQAEFNNAINYWTMPTEGSTDIFSMTLDQSCYCHPLSTHSSSPGNQLPRTGDVMSNITVYGDGGCDPYREYLQGQLNTPMVPGETYTVEFYVSFADNCTYATNNQGVYFTTTPVNSGSMCTYQVTPHLNNTTVITEMDDWELISFTFTPTDAYEYFMIGNFYLDNATNTTYMGGSKSTVRYFVDDVKIEVANTPPTSDFTADSPICIGEPSTITYTGTASSSATYHWSFESADSVSGSGQGPYEVFWANPGDYDVSLWVEENGLSSDTTTITVTVNPIPTPYFDITGLNCYGDDATVTYTGPAGSGATYNWDFGGATVISGSGQGPYVINWSTAGTHTVSLDVTENGCSSLPNSENINHPSELQIDLDVTDISCNGADDGSITANISGGTSPYDIIWSNTSTNNTITGLTEDTYSVTVTDDNGCTAEESASVVEPDPFTISAGSDQNICYGDTVDISAPVSGGVSPVTHYWNDGSGFTSGNSPYSVSPGSDTQYQVYAEDDNGCQTSTVTVDVTVSSPINIDIDLQHVSCYGECDATASASVSGGIAPYQYSWPSGTDTQTGLCAGNYNLEITDDIGCTENADFEITQPDELQLDLAGTDVSCYGETDGSIQSTVTGGTTPYTYNWSNTETTENITGIAADDYDLTVTDANGCTVSETITIDQPAEVEISVSDDLYLCAGEAANMNATATGGSPPYTYYWESGGTYTAGNTNHTEYPYSSQDYGVFAEDANGCTSDTALIHVSMSSVMHLNLQIDDISCHSFCDGSASLGITGGIEPYEYSWNSNDSTLNGLCPGFYEVTVTDQNACERDTFFTITEPDTLIGNIYSENPLCPGSSDGQAWVSAEGGVPPYEYQWTYGQTDDTATNLQAGLHEVTITDANGCQISLETYLTDPDDIIITGLGNRQICIGGTATVNAAVTGGTPPYFYHWEGSDGEEWSGSQLNVSPEETTDYTLVVTDANQCADSAAITVNVYPELQILDFYAENDSVCKGESTKLEFDIGGGNGGPYEVALNGNNIITSPHAIDPEYSGWYKIKVNDACETPAVYDSIYITVLDLPENNFISDKSAACPPASFTFNALNPNNEYTYQWIFGDNAFAYGDQATHLYENSGHYDVTLLVTDQYGCSKQNTTQNMIRIYPVPDIDFYTRPDVISMLNPEVEFYPVTSNTDSLYWYFGDGDSTVSNNWNPVHTYDGVGNFEIQVIGANKHNCRDTTWKVIKIKEHFTFYAPTAFSPNYDGENDCFSVCGAGIDPYEFSLKVYDRWG